MGTEICLLNKSHFTGFINSGLFTEEAELAAHQLPQQQGIGHRYVNFCILSSNCVPKKDPEASALSPELCKIIHSVTNTHLQKGIIQDMLTPKMLL